ncbi:N-acetyltransferase [Candidatus Bathyarchaeota archaeon]|jgi:RimJ/RimL family protein N-acetyltransferase|nr:N-acetyltransferase [Candidatus Bathyarchaeota archaeon]MBT4319422.1 N-acetyltransferase [Candidatus Bathyarchaeota archaeon]MBT4422940.1 N-acetyltransferase [Candidatus Bathyarchaeota archaeon]MBT6603796.1 N-acetyltransferase [Candidatus Bathyarchaeota archaeon]MBT7187271.1 N-acetyltransferase [Candidatus Bathyarchaeota archaeon]
MSTEPFWMKPKKINLKDGIEVTLRPEIDSDLEPSWEMFSSLSDESLTFLPQGVSRERVEGWFKDIDFDKSLPILGFVETDEGSKMVTSAVLVFQSEEIYKHKATFGISVRDSYQNKGLGHILTEYMLEIAKGLGLKKVELSVVTHNSRAIHLYEKFGFEKEGLVRMDHWNHTLGKYGNSYNMGIILAK